MNRQSDITQCERMTQCEKTAKADKRLATPTLEGARCDACHKRQFWDEDENEGKRTERRRGTLGNSLKDRQKQKNRQKDRIRAKRGWTELKGWAAWKTGHM